MYTNYGLFLLIVISTGSVSAAATTAAADIACSKTDLENSCSVRFPDRVVVHDGSVYVGVENKLVRFGLKLDVQSVVERNPSPAAISDCQRYRQPHCGNYILTMLAINLTSSDIPANGNMQFVNKTVLFICSTFGFSPQCQLCNTKNISHCVNTSDEVTSGYSPYDRRFNNVYTLTKNHIFYTGSSFDDKNRLQAVAKASNPFHGSRFSLHTGTSQTWLFNPTFISLYEVDQYIYFFWREEAFEADRRVYTRVGRLCKSDEGLGNDSSSSIFSTFVKARMTCIIPEDNDNRYPFEYNELQATYLVDDDEIMLYAVFSTPSNGPASSAICTYTFGNDENNLNTVFNGDYLFGNSGSEAWTTVINPAPFDCPGNGSNQRSTQDAQRYLLMEESVQQSTPLPIHIETGAHITALVVDTVQWNGKEVEVLYIGLSNGIVKQVVKNIHVVELYTTPSNQRVNKLILHENNGTKYCYITSDDNIAVIQLRHCGYYQSCSQCTNDIYCRWNGHSCTSDVSITANVTCPTTEPTTTVNNVNVTTIYWTNVHTVTIQEKCTIPVVGPVVNAPNTGDSNIEKTCNDIPVVIGTTIGGLVLGFIIGAIVFVSIYFIKRSRSSPKESAVRQGSIESKEYDDDAFDPPSTNQSSRNCYTHHPQMANGQTDLVNMSIGRGHLAGQVGRSRTESTKRLISISSDLYPDSPSPPNTLRMPKHDE